MNDAHRPFPLSFSLSFWELQSHNSQTKFTPFFNQPPLIPSLCFATKREVLWHLLDLVFRLRMIHFRRMLTVL
jgi:hypothetical protein